MFRFANPELTALLLVLPLMWAIFIVATINRKRRVAKFGNPELINTLMPLMSRTRRVVKFILVILSVTLVVFAIARPQLGSKLREVKSEGVEMMLVVDVSNSMLAEDFEPNRLERTKHAVNQLFNSMEQDRVGLIAFAGEAAVKLPITADYRMAQSQAGRLSPQSVSRQGTSIAKALELAMLSFSSNSEASKVIILITDGEEHDGGALAVAQRAKEAGVKLFTIGIGTPEGALVSIDGEIIRDENGEMVVTRLDEATLQQIATITEGGYVRASRSNIGLAEIVDSIEQMEKSELTTISFEEYNELFHVLLSVAVVLLLLEFIIRERVNKAFARFNLFK
ncbi:MAG: VWA domain-containing protein [Rikenellaceae bacterium]